MIPNEDYHRKDMEMNNPIIEAMMNRKSIRKYTDESPSDEIIHTIFQGVLSPRKEPALQVHVTMEQRK